MWWLWVLIIPPACVLLSVLITIASRTINYGLIGRIRHKRLVRLLEKDEILRKLVDKVNEEKIILSINDGETSGFHFWLAIHTSKTKIIKVHRRSLNDFHHKKIDSITMALFLSHEIGHFKWPILPTDCHFLTKGQSCLYEEIRAFIGGLRILEEAQINGWKSTLIHFHISNILLTQCGHCFQANFGAKPNPCSKFEEIKKLNSELEEMFKDAD